VFDGYCLSLIVPRHIGTAPIKQTAFTLKVFAEYDGSRVDKPPQMWQRGEISWGQKVPQRYRIWKSVVGNFEHNSVLLTGQCSQIAGKISLIITKVNVHVKVTSR